MRRADRHLHGRRVALAVLAAVAVALASPLVAEAGPSPTPSPAPSYNPQACDNSDEFTIQSDPVTCVENAAGAVASWVGDQAIQDVASWITTAAASASAQLLGTLRNEAARPTLNTPWFTTVYFGRSGGSGSRAPGAVVIAAWLMVAVVIGAVMSGVIRGDLSGMLRLLLLRLPVAVLVTYLATWMVSAVLALTDVASNWVLSGGIQSLQSWTNQLQNGGLGHDFLTVVACLALIVATLLGYLELLARDAAIYIVTAFVPLIAVASLWPGAHNALKRGAETLFVLCVSKFVLVFVLVLGATALAQSTAIQSFAPLLTGTLIFLIAALAPAAIFRLIPILEVSAVAGLAGGASRFGARAAARGHALLGTGLDQARAGTSRMGDRMFSTPAGPAAGGSTGPPDDLRLAGAGGDGGSAPSDGPGPSPGPPTSRPGGPSGGNGSGGAASPHAVEGGGPPPGPVLAGTPPVGGNGRRRQGSTP
jgi:hypothetical protein